MCRTYIWQLTGGIYHIDKPDFLVLYQQARMLALSEKNIKSAFQTVGLVPYNPEMVLSRFQVRTPSPRVQLLQPQLQDQESQLPLPLQTPHNIIELGAQVKALQEHRTKAMHDQTSPTDQALHYLVKGCQLTVLYSIIWTYPSNIDIKINKAE